jgi:hypothetical protein
MGAISFSIDEKLVALFCEALPLKVFVETGTFKGESLQVARRFFSECHTVELSPEYHAAAVKRFAGQPGVQVHLGESPAYLRSHAEQFAAQPVLFWLDAHWCVAENTAGENSQSPLLGELAAVGKLHPQSVVMIDDARLYLCCPPAPHRVSDWPDLQAVLEVLLPLSASHRLIVLNDVFIFYPAALQSVMARFSHEHGTDWLTLSHQAEKYRRKKERINRLNPFRSKR